jgi:hypothetical protein
VVNVSGVQWVLPWTPGRWRRREPCRYEPGAGRGNRALEPAQRPIPSLPAGTDGYTGPTWAATGGPRFHTVALAGSERRGWPPLRPPWRPVVTIRTSFARRGGSFSGPGAPLALTRRRYEAAGGGPVDSSRRSVVITGGPSTTRRYGPVCVSPTPRRQADLAAVLARPGPRLVPCSAWLRLVLRGEATLLLARGAARRLVPPASSCLPELGAPSRSKGDLDDRSPDPSTPQRSSGSRSWTGSGRGRFLMLEFPFLGIAVCRCLIIGRGAAPSPARVACSSSAACGWPLAGWPDLQRIPLRLDIGSADGLSRHPGGRWSRPRRYRTCPAVDSSSIARPRPQRRVQLIAVVVPFEME